MATTKKIWGTNLIFRNFSGRESQWNEAGSRVTGVIIPADRVNEFVDEGWNVKIYVPKTDPQAEPTYYINAKVRYDNFPPRIYIKTPFSEPLKIEDEKDLDQLDRSEIDFVDVELNLSMRKAAYVKTMFVNTIVDDFEEKYFYGDRED